MQTTRIKGLTIAALGVLFIVPDALLVKITSVEPLVFLFLGRASGKGGVGAPPLA